MKNIEYISELSPAQQGMLFHTVYAPEAGMYFNQSCWRLAGALDVACCQAAWQQLVDRHATLRTAFFWEELEKPVQVAYQSVTLPWNNLDWRGFSAEEQEARFATLLTLDREQGVQLEKAPLMRMTMIQTDEETYRFLWSCHHLLTDGWSTAILFKEFLLFYNALRQGERVELPTPHSYREYIGWLQQQDMAAAERFWRQQLAGFQTPTKFPMAKPLLEAIYPVSRSLNSYETGKNASENQGYHQETYATRYDSLDAEITAQLETLARTHHLTMNGLMQGAWAILLSCYSGEDDVLFGTTLSGRPTDLPGVETMVGLFINTLPARVQVPSETTLIEWLQSLMHQQAERERYLYSPLVEVQGWSELPSEINLFDSILVVENYPVDEMLNDEQLVDFRVEEFYAVEQDQYPITMVVMPGNELRLQVLYSADRFDDAAIVRMLGHYKELLKKMVQQPEQRIADLSLLTEREREQLIVDWNKTAVEYPTDRCVHHLFEEQAALAPEAIALLRADGTTMTYRELNERANQVAHRLRKLGVGTTLGAEPFVAICASRSAALVVGMLGILKAGGAYVPLDPTYPKARLAFMLTDAQAPILLTQEELIAKLPPYAGEILALNSDLTLYQEPTENLSHDVDVRQLAYMIYTSGSTGNPKGVMIEHRNAVNYLLWARDRYDVTSGSGAPVNSSVSFDATITSLLLPLMAGRTVQLLPEEGEIEALSEQLQAQLDFSLIKITPAHLYMLNQMLPPEGITASARALVIGGEQLLQQHVDFWRTHAPDTRLINEYGPTETVVGCAVYEISTAEGGESTTDNEIVPIGRPIANTQLYVLDPQGEPTPIGVPGELYIGGAGVGRGYWQRPELTATKFVDDPFSDEPGARLYRTGDLARYLPDGNLEFLGRIDQQVKLRGYRIELGEIDTQINAYPSIKESATLLVGKDAEERQLIAYVVPVQPHHNGSGELLITQLQEHLAETLPTYMMPTEVLLVDALPLTPNGKLDRNRLIEMHNASSAEQTVNAPALPQTETEVVLAEIWRDVLGQQEIGIHDNFFARGGNSLLATKVISRAYRRFRVRLPLQLIFEQSTIAAMAANIEATQQTLHQLQAQPIGAASDTEEEGEI